MVMVEPRTDQNYDSSVRQRVSILAGDRQTSKSVRRLELHEEAEVFPPLLRHNSGISTACVETSWLAYVISGS
jgi:hypothetical protein